MATTFIHIEFKFPVKNGDLWGSFSARACEVVGDRWEIYAVKANGPEKEPFKKVVLNRVSGKWIEVGADRETLLSALLGRAIEKAKGRPL